MATPNYDINYNDERFTKVETEKQQALTDNEKFYGGMIEDSDDYYQAQIDASKQWAEKQQELQQQQTDFAIEKIEQEKEQTKQDYIKEQSGAYVDWQKQSNQYGANAEQMAAMGMAKTGYSESSQVSMYNAYQNRVATARETYSRAVLNFNNSIQEAKLQNNSILAEIAAKALEQQLELSLQGFQYKNELLQQQANRKLQIDEVYHQRYQDVLAQINYENALAEEIRQYNETLALQKQAQADEKAYKDAQLALQREQFNWQKSQAAQSSSGTIKKSSSGSSKGKATTSSGTTKISAAANIKASTPSFSSYSDAAAYLRSQGATTSDGGLMTKDEWRRRKASGSNRAETAYSSYSEYLNAFVAYRLANPTA